MFLSFWTTLPPVPQYPTRPSSQTHARLVNFQMGLAILAQKGSINALNVTPLTTFKSFKPFVLDVQQGIRL